MDGQKEINLNDLIKALRCLASCDPENNCYIDNYNFDSNGQRMSCYGSPETIKCPYNQQTYSVCFDDGECNEWLENASELLKELQQYHQIGTVEECRTAVEMIDEQPTAYDPDKVIENLNMQKSGLTEWTEDKAFKIGIEKAIEVVKAGGIRGVREWRD